VPTNGNASGSQVIGKRLKVICGADTSYLADSEWIGDKTPLTLCDVRVSPSNSVKPNIGATELADTLARVLPFTATDDARPILQCVNFVAKEGKLTLVSADGFRLAVTSLDYDDGEGQALVNGDDLRGMINALKRAKRARVSFEPSGESLDGMDETFDRGILVAEEVIFAQVLPDTLGAQTPGYCCLDDAAIWLAGAGRAGGHFGGFGQMPVSLSLRLLLISLWENLLSSP